jgi:NAD(P)H-hydrate epimerase
MKILTAAQMREVDRRTTAERGIPSLILMENAGVRVFEFLAERFAPLSGQRVLVLCGKGNNGGDGLVVARQLLTRGGAGKLTVVLAGEPESLQGDAAANYRMFLGVNGEPRIITSEPEWVELLSEVQDWTVVVDALLGTGARGPAEGLCLRMIRDVNARLGNARVVAVDIPSGLSADSGERLGEAIRAHHTITFTTPKVGLIFPPSCEAVGELRVVSIGSAPGLYENDPEIFLSTIEAADIAPLFAPRARDAHKGDFGHVLVVAGSTPKPGAAALAGTAALRAGAGMVTVATTARAASTLVAHTPELMTEPLPETELGTISLAAFDYQRFERIAARKDVIALGPGLGANDEARAFMRKVAKECGQRLVLDADALLAENVRAGAVLTPHPGEMARLTGIETAEIQSRRVEVARRFAQDRGVYLVLKGFRTLVAAPDGRVLVNLTGTPAMASAGSGDVLTGMIAGFLAQFPQAPPEQAIAAAVFLHGLAGELAASRLGESSTLATDLLDALPAAIASLRDA